MSTTYQRVAEYARLFDNFLDEIIRDETCIKLLFYVMIRRFFLADMEEFKLFGCTRMLLNFVTTPNGEEAFHPRAPMEPGESKIASFQKFVKQCVEALILQPTFHLFITNDDEMILKLAPFEEKTYLLPTNVLPVDICKGMVACAQAVPLQSSKDKRQFILRLYDCETHVSDEQKSVLFSNIVQTFSSLCKFYSSDDFVKSLI